MKWIYSVAALQVSLNSNNIIQNLTFSLFCHYGTVDLHVQFGGKGGEPNRGWHLESICTYSEKLPVTHHRVSGSAVGQLWATI